MKDVTEVKKPFLQKKVPDWWTNNDTRAQNRIHLFAMLSGIFFAIAALSLPVLSNLLPKIVSLPNIETISMVVATLICGVLMAVGSFFMFRMLGYAVYMGQRLKETAEKPVQSTTGGE